MAKGFIYERRVTFNETDMAGIVHYANFFRYMEEAEHAFFRTLGFSIETVVDGKRFGWPRVETSCRYLSPLFFEDVFQVALQIAEIRPKGLKYEFAFSRDEQDLAIGYLSNVCVTMEKNTAGKTTMRACEIPAPIRDALSPYIDHV